MEHRIITGDALPVRQKPRRIPKAWEGEVDAQIKEMLENEIIRPSASPWNSPIILVKKKDNSARFVCDFRDLSDVTKKDTYPFPHIKDVIDKMEGAKFWSTLDAASGYWSMPLAELDKEKAAFSVPVTGKFEFNVTPYGLSNAGASYQRMIDICLAGLPPNRILACMDDIPLFNTTFEQHMEDLEAVFKFLRQSNISLKASKCVIASHKVDFKSDHLADYLDLTFIIDSGGKLSTRLYDKRDDFDFHIVNFPYLSSNIHLALLMVCTFHSSLDMHDAAHTMMISDIATSAWLIDFCHKAI